MSPYRARGDNVSSTSGEVDIGTSEPEGADVPDPSVNQGILGPYDDCRLPNALRGHEVPGRHCGRRGWTMDDSVTAVAFEPSGPLHIFTPYALLIACLA